MREHLPALQVVLPLLGALAAALFRRPRLAWLIAAAASVASFAIAILLLQQVLASGPIAYEIGGWPRDLGIEYRVDLLNAIVLVLVASTATILMPFAARSVADELPADRVAWFYAMYLLCLTGLLGIAITGDAFNAFVFLEISSLSTYTMIALGRDRRALLGAYQYLVMGTIGATFYIIGVGFLYVMTGTLNLGLMAERLALVGEARPVLVALAFLTVGISLKLALFPLHAWLPNAYAFAPSTATVFLAATATKVAIYLLVRYVFAVFHAGFYFHGYAIGVVLIALSLAAVFGASTVAIFQSNVKRLLAYSSVGQIGYITLGIALASMPGLTGGLVHLVGHALLKATLFMAIGAVVFRTGTANLEELGGIGRKMPLTMGAFVVAGLGLVGMPGTVGFVSKWYLILAAFEQGWWWLAFLIVAGSILAVLYVGRVVEVAWFRPVAPKVEGAVEAPAEMLAGIWLLAAATVWLGLDTDLTAGLAGKAAELLIGGAR